MKKSIICFLSLMIILSLFTVGSLSAAAEEKYTVQQVTELLEGIDSLQQMQDKRSSYTVTKHYNANNASVVASHQSAREGYESYVADMSEARRIALEAYNSLTTEERAEISPSLTAKLENELDTVLSQNTYPVTPSDDEYIYQIIAPNFMAYEVSSSYIRTGDVAGTLILVDTTKVSDTWTPDRKYSYGECNYELTYCCDLLTLPRDGTHYKRTNLESSEYYDEHSAEMIRAITEISYPFLSVEEMKAELIRGGLEEDLVASLTRSDLITSVQMAIWSYANVNDEAFNHENVTHYGGTLRMKNHPYIPILHDYTNECWNWFSQNKPYRTFDSREEERVNRLTAYLCSLEPEKGDKDQMVISQLDVLETELIDSQENMYHITMYIALDGGGNEKDDLDILASSYTVNSDGTTSLTENVHCDAVNNDGVYAFTIHAKDGDMVDITVEGRQMLAKGAYFYDCGSRDASQSLVGISEGMTSVKASKSVVFLSELAKKPVTDIEIEAPEITVDEGETVQVAVTVKPEDATNKELIFKSEDESVVTVDEKGNITAVGPGKATVTIISADNPSIRKEIIITVPEPAAAPVIPEIPRTHHICFGKTDGIGWYEVAVNGGDFHPQGPNSTLEVAEGSIIVVRVQDMWIDDDFTFYVNGRKVEKDPANTITLVVDGYMLIGALSMDFDVPDIEQSLNWFQKLIKAIGDFFSWLFGLFKR